MEEAAKQLPFTFKVPQSYEELTEHFENRSPEEKSIILERMVKCNHPQFGDDNKAKLETLFTLVLQHLHDCASEEDQVSILWKVFQPKMLEAGNAYRRERLSTIDLLIKAACFVKKVNNVYHIKINQSKLNEYK